MGQDIFFDETTESIVVPVTKNYTEVGNLKYIFINTVAHRKHRMQNGMSLRITIRMS